MKNGTIINQYKIISAIGKGGMGEVFLAQDTKLDRKVALKILPPEFAEDKDRMSRFVREAKSASALNHPNIITIYEIGESDGTHFIATEFIEGKTLNDYVKANPLNYKSALEIAIQVASALDEAHSANIVHRDIKPDNVMIRSNGLVKLLDFGIAKMSEPPAVAGGLSDEDATAIKPNSTSPGMIIGTPNYMSPEQARGKDVDHQTDIFSFGVVFYEMLSGSSPFSGETVSDVIAAVLTKEPKRLSEIPVELSEILNKTLEKDKKNRYQTAKDLLLDLQEAKEELSVQSRLERTSSPNLSEPQTQILQAVTTAETDSNKSIAVLPFANLSADGENDYFCEGLAEELLNALSKINDLKVAARTSAFSFKGKNMEAREIGEKLNVKNVLEGSVRKSGGKLRISVQLVNAADGYQLWSERYDRELKDIFDVQDEIALAVVDALKVKLFGDAKEAVLKRYTSNAEAYQLYLRGRFFFFKRTPEGFKKALEYFEQAITLDESYALAYSGIADSYILLGFYELIAPAEAKKRVMTAAHKALELDAALAESHTSFAFYQTTYEWDFPLSDQHNREAIALNPKYALTHHLHSANLILLGQTHESIEAESYAVELEPFTVIFNASLGWWCYLSRRNEEAIQHSLRTIEIAANHFFGYWVLGLAYVQDGKLSDAISALQRAASLTIGNQHIKGDLGRAYARIGQVDEAYKILDELLNQAKDSYVSPVNIAKIYAGLGDREKVFQWLEKACDERAVKLPWFMIDPSLDAFRDDKRFQNLMKKTGLPTDKATADSGLGNADLGSKAEHTTNPKSEIRNPKSKWPLIGLLTLLLAVGGFFGYKYLSPTTKQINSIAVMPFVNESKNEEVEYLSDGMTETLISSLSNIPNLSVKARSTVFYYKGKETSAKKIGEELKVQAVLFGRVSQRGDDLKLSLELVNTETQDVIWSDTYNRKQSDLVSLQSEIAKTVSDKLRLKLTATEQERVSKTNTTSSEAQQLYLKGRFHWNKRNTEDFQKAREYFEQAIAIDPNYALAHTGLADTLALMPNFGNFRPSEYMPLAKQSAQKALELDPNLAEAHASLGQILYAFDYDFKGAERELKRAIELDPKYPSAHQWLAENYLFQRNFDQALAEVDKALELDPLAMIINSQKGVVLLSAGKLDEAIAQFKKTVDLFPDAQRPRSNLALTYYQKGMYAEEVEQRLIVAKLVGDSPELVKTLQLAFEKEGYKSFVQKQLEIQLDRQRSTMEKDKNTYFPAWGISGIYARLQDKDKTLEYLTKAYEQREPGITEIKVRPSHYFLRDDPRFKELVKKVGIPE